METPVHRLERLVSALEDLTSQESLLLRAGDFAGVVRTQGRAAPLVEAVAGLSTVAGVSVRARVAEIVARRKRGEELLAGTLAHTSAALKQLQTNQQRLAQIRPVYGTTESRGQRLRMVG